MLMTNLELDLLIVNDNAAAIAKINAEYSLSSDYSTQLVNLAVEARNRQGSMVKGFHCPSKELFVDILTRPNNLLKSATTAETEALVRKLHVSTIAADKYQLGFYKGEIGEW